MARPIPEDWRSDVVRILRARDARQINWTLPAFQRWMTDTNGGWRHEAYDAMIVALSDLEVQGEQTTSYPGQVATYEFLFWFQTTRMYGKIALLDKRLSILILSAHRAQRDAL